MKRTAMTVLLLSALGCGGGEGAPVLDIDGTTWTASEFEEYLASNLPETDDVGDLVRSRVFDTWVEERLVLQEARERELSIGDEQLDDLLEDPDFEGGTAELESRRRQLRERLLIELLQALVLSDVPPPSGADIDAWIRARGGAGSGKQVRLRSLRLDDRETADRIHSRLRENRLTFNEAVVQYGGEADPDAPAELDLDSLPPEVRAAIEDLKKGWSSAPVELGRSVYLFQVLDWTEGDPQRLRDEAERDLQTARRREAWRSFVTRLRDKARIRIVERNLPFAYVAEDPAQE